MPIQGTSAEMIKIAMVSISNYMNENNMDSKLVLQIHDELVFEAPNNELKDLESMVIDKMIKALPLSVPIDVDSGFGESWYEAH